MEVRGRGFEAAARHARTAAICRLPLCATSHTSQQIYEYIRICLTGQREVSLGPGRLRAKECSKSIKNYLFEIYKFPMSEKSKKVRKMHNLSSPELSESSHIFPTSGTPENKSGSTDSETESESESAATASGYRPVAPAADSGRRRSTARRPTPHPSIPWSDGGYNHLCGRVRTLKRAKYHPPQPSPPHPSPGQPTATISCP